LNWAMAWPLSADNVQSWRARDLPNAIALLNGYFVTILIQRMQYWSNGILKSTICFLFQNMLEARLFHTMWMCVNHNGRSRAPEQECGERLVWDLSAWLQKRSTLWKPTMNSSELFQRQDFSESVWNTEFHQNLNSKLSSEAWWIGFSHVLRLWSCDHMR
jgi:hypothetical protein